MDIFKKISLKTLKRSKIKTLVTVLGVAITACLFTIAFEFVHNFIGYIDDVAVGMYGNYHMEIYNADTELINKLEKNDDVEHIIVAGRVGETYLTQDTGMYGVSVVNEAFFKYNKVNLKEGRLPKNNKEIIVPQYTKVSDNIKLGQKLDLKVGAVEWIEDKNEKSQKMKLSDYKEYNYKVVGFYEEYVEQASLWSYVEFMTLGEDETILENYGTLYIGFKEGTRLNLDKFLKKYKIKDINRDIQLNVDEEFVISDQDYYIADYNSDRLLSLGVVPTNNPVIFTFIGITLIILVIALITFILLYTTFSLSVEEGMLQIGLLGSVGATKKQISKMIRTEIVVISLIAIPVGVLVGNGLVMFVCKVLREDIAMLASSSVLIDYKFSIISIVVAVLSTIYVIILATFIPTKKATDIEAIEAIKNIKEDDNNKDVKVSKLISKIFGAEGYVAAKYFKIRKKQYKLVVLSLVASIFMIMVPATITTFVSDNEEVESVDMITDTEDMMVINMDKLTEEQAKQYENGEMSEEELVEICGEELTEEEYQEHLNSMTEDDNTSSDNTIIIANVFMGLFIIIIIVIAILNVYNMISTNIIINRKDISVLRSVGMSFLSIKKMILLEGIICGLKAIQRSVPLYIIITLVSYVFIKGTDIMYAIINLPYVGILSCVLVVLGTIIVSTLYSAKKIEKQDMSLIKE